MTSPFDWRGKKPTIQLDDLQMAHRNSLNMVRVINDKRAQGIEPSIIYSTRMHDPNPKKFAMTKKKRSK